MASTGNVDFQTHSESSVVPPTNSAGQLSMASHTAYFLDSTQTSHTTNRKQTQEICAQKSDTQSTTSTDSLEKSSLTKDEKFELLSAYLDDEVTAEERALVNHWLASDPEMQDNYQKQRQLKLAFKALLS